MDIFILDNMGVNKLSASHFFKKWTTPLMLQNLMCGKSANATKIKVFLSLCGQMFKCCFTIEIFVIYKSHVFCWQQIPERWASRLGWSSWDTERPGQLWKVHYHPLYHSTQARYGENVKTMGWGLLTGKSRGVLMRELILETHCVMEDL